ncbi:MAG: D-2-hydroxyacid dehydrogenase [Erysipelotrichaceae bacterium]|nr:D-2-hydroxyacid dehydrogenase [Erysipelotrichaceae bacterium]
MPVRIIVTNVHSDETIQKFRSLPDAEVIFAPKTADIRPEDLAEAEIFVGSLKPDIAALMPKLRYVQLYSAGANNYTWLPEHIILANAYGAYGDVIAEHMLTTTLMTLKRMPEYLDMQQRQDWTLLKDIRRIENAKVMSVGMGAIGTAYLRMANALGAECYGVRRTLHDQPEFVKTLVAQENMDDLLPEMNIVALSLPGTPEVAGMFDEKKLRMMKKTAVLLNVGRGNSIVTDDLIKVMNEGHLKAACLDVMDPEPLPKGHPLWTTPRVYITPHISGGYRAGVNYERVIDTVINNLTLYLEGKPPVHIVDRTLGY